MQQNHKTLTEKLVEYVQNLHTENKAFRLPRKETDGLTLPGFRSYLNVNTTQETGVWTWE